MLVGIAVLSVLAYPTLPDVIPTHGDFSGNVNEWKEKSPWLAVFPFGMAAFIALIFIICQIIVPRMYKYQFAADEERIKQYYDIMARPLSIWCLVSGLLLSAVLGYGIELSFMGVINLGQLAIAIIVFVFACVASMIAISVKGNRQLKEQLSGQDIKAGDYDPEHWKLGFIYFNRDDERIMIPDRLSVGWTINFARPMVWVVIALLLVITAVVYLCLTFLVKK